MLLSRPQYVFGGTLNLAQSNPIQCYCVKATGLDRGGVSTPLASKPTCVICTKLLRNCESPYMHQNMQTDFNVQFSKKILGQCTYIHILWMAVPHQTLH